MKYIFPILVAFSVLTACTHSTIDLSEMRVWTETQMNNDAIAQIWVDESTDGNGTFYLAADCGSAHSNIIRIGADIAPQNLLIEGNAIIVNYAEQTAAASVGRSMYVNIDDMCVLALSSR